MKQELIIRSLPQAFDLVKQIGLSEDWDAGYRVSGRRALGEILESRKSQEIPARALLTNPPKSVRKGHERIRF